MKPRLACLALTLSMASALEGLPGATTCEEAMQYIDLPNAENDVLPEVVRGRVRYISQTKRSSAFVKAYWLGGEEGSSLDLTL